MLRDESVLWSQNLTYLAGVDEVGRGALAGPVVAVAVVFPPHTAIDGIQDSKILTKRARKDGLKKICHSAIDLGVGFATPREIDKLNVLHASLLAMHRAVTSLDCIPQAILVDGRRSIPDMHCSQLALVKGDQRSQSIAAASIVAKVTRDQFMQQLHNNYPQYGWSQNVGYPTKGHYAALHEIGPCTHHRQSFRLK
ncbi:MAG: ribonuclease HII [Bacteroidetes bacterium]|nr:ribonuclease HII [Bacteroidota bacterium]